MSSITYIGLDVHTTNYTICSFNGYDGNYFGEVTVKPEYQQIEKYVRRLQKQYEPGHRFLCGYEAGYLGYSLFHVLASVGIECVILAPSTMCDTKTNRQIKADPRDARNIANCLAYGLYSAVHVPTEQDDAVMEYMRMRDSATAEPAHPCLSFAHCCLLRRLTHRLPLLQVYGALSLHAFALRLSCSSVYA